MKELIGSELAGFIKERQARQVRALRQSWKVFPKLAIIVNSDNAVIKTYVSLKQQYASDILIDVQVCKVETADLIETIDRLNSDGAIHGIIVQLPLSDPPQTDKVLARILPDKDVDGLGSSAKFDPATPLAINWLLAGYNIALEDKKIVIIGGGRLVGAPLSRMWINSGLDVAVLDESTQDMTPLVRAADIVVTATGVPRLITDSMIKSGAVIVDAGTTASETGEIVGDVAEAVRERNDISITPKKGGVGPLTVAALCENVIQAARIDADKKGQQDL